MKKLIPKLFLILVFVGIIFYVKDYIDKRTYQFKDEVNLTNFYVKNDYKGVTNINKLLDTYDNNDTKRKEIQSYCYSIVGSWFTYLDEKYVCNKTNLNSCKAQLAEFQDLNAKLVKLYSYKSSKGYTVITSSSFTSLKNQADKKIKDLEAVVKSNSYSNPKTSEEIREDKCNKSTDCENCKDGICKCYYTSGGVREELTCNKDIEDK